MDYINFLFLAVSFAVVLTLTPFWIRKTKQIGLVWDDMNKIGKQRIAGSGGIVVCAGFILATLLFIAYHIFITGKNVHLLETYALLLSIVLMACIGLIDDLFGWQHGGLSKRSRLLLVLGASLPLMAINAGKSIITLPFVGAIDVGLFYPLILIPLAFVGAGTTFNFLAGFNGLEAGQGILIVGALSFVAYYTGNSWLAIVGLCMVSALLAFLYYNKYPAKVFPGDVLTYPVGGLIASMAILGNFEKIAFFIFIPVIIEVILKTRGKFTKGSFGIPQKDGSLKQLHNKLYGLTHVSIYLFQRIGIQPTEKRVVYLIWVLQACIIATVLWYARGSIWG